MFRCPMPNAPTPHDQCPDVPCPMFHAPMPKMPPCPMSNVRNVPCPMFRYPMPHVQCSQCPIPKAPMHAQRPVPHTHRKYTMARGIKRQFQHSYMAAWNVMRHSLQIFRSSELVFMEKQTLTLNGRKFCSIKPLKTTLIKRRQQSARAHVEPHTDTSTTYQS